MYDMNNLLDRIRSELYELLEFDPELVASPERETRRREVLHLVAELRMKAEQA